MLTLWRFVTRYIDDAVALTGFVCVTYGLSLWSVPAAWITSGAMLIAVAVVPHLRRGKP
jgi:hypothetical protein